MLPNPIAYHVFDGRPLPQPKFYAYVLAGNGLVKWVCTPYFEASWLISVCRVAGLAEWSPGLKLHIPRVPLRWLLAALTHARQAKAAGRLIEQMYHFHYFEDEAGWRVAVPPQRAGPGRVAYRGAEAGTILLDLHSHHVMSAFFSGTDNRDEQGCRFYGVLGCINWSRPEIALRLGVYGDHFPLPTSVLFEDLGPFRDTYPSEVTYETAA